MRDKCSLTPIDELRASKGAKLARKIKRKWVAH